MWHPVDYFPGPPYPPGQGLPPGHIAWRPMVATTLVVGKNHIACFSILDSGADHCVFPLEFARQLGFNPEGTTPVMTEGVGIAGVPMYYWTITIDLGAAQVEVIAGFTEDMNGRASGSKSAPTGANTKVSQLLPKS